MFNGAFKDRSADQALAELLASRELRRYTLSRNCELGPFLVDYLFIERSLIVELSPSSEPASTVRREARIKFLSAMGYVVWSISPRELLRQPERVLARLRAALERS